MFPTDTLYEQSLKNFVSYFLFDDTAKVINWIMANINSINAGVGSGQSQSHLVYQKFPIGLGRGNGEVFCVISLYSTAVNYR